MICLGLGAPYAMVTVHVRTGNAMVTKDRTMPEKNSSYMILLSQRQMKCEREAPILATYIIHVSQSMPSIASPTLPPIDSVRCERMAGESKAFFLRSTDTVGLNVICIKRDRLSFLPNEKNPGKESYPRRTGHLFRTQFGRSRS